MQGISNYRRKLIYLGFTRSRTKSLEDAMEALWGAFCPMDKANLKLVQELTLNELLKMYTNDSPGVRVIDLNQEINA